MDSSSDASAPVVAGAGGRPGARRVRSYVRREGRLTSGQREALERLWGRYGLGGLDDREPPPSVDPDTVFGRRARRILEIGVGTGDVLVAMAAANPDCDYLGIEVYRPGLGSLLRRLECADVGNVRLFCADAVLVLDRLPAASLDEVHLLFPDPWPKRAHHKRRIVQPAFVAAVARCLVPGGVFHLATDWPDYARHMLRVLEAADGFVNAVAPGRFAERPPERPVSRFERRGLRLGHEVRELRYRRCDDGRLPGSMG